MVQLAQRDHTHSLGCEWEQVLFCWSFVFLPSEIRQHHLPKVYLHRTIERYSSQRVEGGGKRKGKDDNLECERSAD